MKTYIDCAISNIIFDGLPRTMGSLEEACSTALTHTPVPNKNKNNS